MKRIIMLEPSIGTDNLGDQVITEGIKTALRQYIDDAFLIEMSTHNPLSWRYLKFLHRAPIDYNIVCGSNLLMAKINSYVHMRQWYLTMLSILELGPCIFIGIGAQQYHQKINAYSKMAYHYMFHKEFMHSVRDQYTADVLRKIGIQNVINTGCPSMWGLTAEHCKTIPVKKSHNVVFTLTDYKQNNKIDQELIRILKANYEKVSFWPQGNRDYQYFKSLKETDGISVIGPSLEAYDTYLSSVETDYIGTRLHGGIRALQKGVRSLILGVDNRATELSNDFNIPVADRDRLDIVEDKILTSWSTAIDLPVEEIQRFLKQFHINYI